MRRSSTTPWQTYAWSRGCKADGIHLYQWENDVEENGIGIDRNEGFGDYGGWSLRQAAENKMEDEEGMNDLKLTTESWGTLAQSLQKAYDKGLLGDYAYVAKAYSGTLTRSEPNVANNLIIVNGAVK